MLTAGERIKKITVEKGMSLRSVAIKSGVPYNTLYAIVSRKSNRIDIGTIQKICDTLDVDIRYILGATDMPGHSEMTDGEREELEKLETERLLEKELHQRMDNAFLKLNIAGKKRVVENAEDFAKIPEYQKKDNEK